MQIFVKSELLFNLIGIHISSSHLVEVKKNFFYFFTIFSIKLFGGSNGGDNECERFGIIRWLFRAIFRENDEG